MSTHRGLPEGDDFSDLSLVERAALESAYAELSPEDRAAPDAVERAYSCYLLKQLRHRYDQTQNSLFIWEAIAEASKTDAPIPDWCVSYLREVAIKLTALANEVSVHDKSEIKSSSEHAMRGVPEALSFARKGKRNVFASLALDFRDMTYAKLYSELPPLDFRNEVRDTLKSRWWFATNDRALRIIARGKKMLRWWGR